MSVNLFPQPAAAAPVGRQEFIGGLNRQSSLGRGIIRQLSSDPAIPRARTPSGRRRSSFDDGGALVRKGSFTAKVGALMPIDRPVMDRPMDESADASKRQTLFSLSRVELDERPWVRGERPTTVGVTFVVAG
jgi:hypothetical protein